MQLTLLTETPHRIAFVESALPIITHVQDALDLLATVQYEVDATRWVISKTAFTSDFFNLRTGLAGAVLQKFTTYQTKVAIVGDFTAYTSRALQNFMYESNNGNQIFFVATIEEAVQKLKTAV